MKRVCTIAVALFALTVLAAQAADSTHTGYISDAMCGAKHTGTGAACVKKCIQGGEKPVFVDSKKQVWAIDNPDAVTADYYGAKVKVTATEDASAKSMHIDSIAAAQ